MEETDFYLHLISDASLEYYPSNVISDFTTKLPHEFNLTGKWEVALCNIHYHKTWGNISTRDEGKCYVKLFQRTLGMKPILEPKVKLQGTLEPGHFSTPEALIQALFDLFKGIKRWESDSSIEESYFNLEDVLGISLDRHTNKLSFSIKKNLYRCDAITLQLSSTLLNLIGHHEFHNSERITQINLAMIPENGIEPTKILTGIVNLKAGIHNIFCYSSIVRNVTVGDTQAPLLRIVPIHGGDEGEYIYETFEDRQYVPIALSNFNSIRIFLGDRLGNNIKFSHGSAPVILVFHLKRVA